MGMADDLELYDLRARPAPQRDAECLQFYEDVYGPSFPDPAIREEVDAWLELLAVEPVPPRPRLHVIVAAERDRRPGESSRIRAGFVCEYYARSGAALGTYLAVAPDVRRHGLARRLVELGRQVLAADAGRPGGPGPVLFAETEKPEQSAHEFPAEVAARLAALARLGFLRSELPYVQPPLGPGKPPVDRMLLLVHGPSLAGPAADGATPGAPAAVSAQLVESFLRDFYESLGTRPDASPAFQVMRRWLGARDPVPLLPLAPLIPGAPAAARAAEPPRG